MTNIESLFKSIRESAWIKTFEFKQSIILVAQTVPEDLPEKYQTILMTLRDNGGVMSVGDLTFGYFYHPTDIEELIDKGLLTTDY